MIDSIDSVYVEPDIDYSRIPAPICCLRLLLTD
jgi:hypothetical protein